MKPVTVRPATTLGSPVTVEVREDIERIQRRRTKGWRMPENTVYVGRPSIFGNPFEAYKCECCGYWDVRDDNGVTYLVDHEYVRRPEVRADRRTWTTRDEARAKAVELYVCELTYWLGGRMEYDREYAEAVRGLRGKNLACWCPLDQPCHADVLLELANQEDR
jgi:hypothetical protein